MHAAPVQTSDNHVGQIRSLLDYEPRNTEVSLDNSDGTLDYEEIRKIVEQGKKSGVLRELTPIEQKTVYREPRIVQKMGLDKKQRLRLANAWRKLRTQTGITYPVFQAKSGISEGSIANLQNMADEKIIHAMEVLIDLVTKQTKKAKTK